MVGYPRTKTSHQRFYVEHDPQRGWRNVPNADGWFSTDEYDVHLQYNARGIRGPELPYEKPAGTYRVVMLGDSFLEGYSVNREDRVSEQLEKLLAAQDPSRKYEVIALGTAGYSTDQELIWLESEGGQVRSRRRRHPVLHERRLVQRAVEILARREARVRHRGRRAEADQRPGARRPSRREEAAGAVGQGHQALDPRQLEGLRADGAGARELAGPARRSGEPGPGRAARRGRRGRRRAARRRRAQRVPEGHAARNPAGLADDRGDPRRDGRRRGRGRRRLHRLPTSPSRASSTRRTGRRFWHASGSRRSSSTRRW